MERLTDKGVLAVASCVLAFGPGVPSGLGIAVLLAGIACAGAVELADTPAWLGCASAAGIVAGTLVAPSLFGCLLPIAAYELAFEQTWTLRLAWLACLVGVALAPDAGWQFVLIFICATLATLMGLRTGALLRRTADLHDLRDAYQEQVLSLAASRRELEDARDDQAHAAALAERARISREIHDSVGHLLTRSLLQVEALEVVHEDEPDIADGLSDVRNTLAEALDVTRRSVHAMADEAIDLPTELHRLAQGSGIAEANVSYGCEGAPPAELSRTMLAITCEALTNAARHARATQVSIRVAEFPGLWQLVITNNGTLPVLDPTRDAADQLVSCGMGVRGMWDRTEAHGGTFRIASEGGRFSVFASFPRTE